MRVECRPTYYIMYEEGFFVIKMLCHIMPLPHVNRVCFYYAFRVSIIFPTFNQLHCRTIIWIATNMVANANFLHLVAFKRQNDKCNVASLVFSLLHLSQSPCAHASGIGTHQTNRKKMENYFSRINSTRAWKIK